MSSRLSPGDAVQRWVDENGRPSNQFFEFADSTAQRINLLNRGINQLARFSSTVDVTDTIVNPRDGFTVMLTGTGAITYSAADDEWRLTADDTTVVI